MPKCVTVRGDAAREPLAGLGALGPSLALWALYPRSELVRGWGGLGPVFGGFVRARD